MAPVYIPKCPHLTYPPVSSHFVIVGRPDMQSARHYRLKGIDPQYPTARRANR